MKLPRPERRKGRIEIIPMIDAIFFLLVYFIMLSLSMVRMDTKGVQLPESRTARLGMGERVVVTMTRAGVVYLDDARIHEPELLPLLRERVAQNPRLSIIINCDRERKIDQFLRVFDLVKQANARTVMIATRPTAQPVGGAR